MPYLPIESYGLIGNMRTCALVGINGSIDWFCAPRFDSPSLFAAILDDGKGGRFRIAPVDGDARRAKQIYWPDTNVLVTRFMGAASVAEIEDFMPVGPSSEPHRDAIIRRVHSARGESRLRLICEPAFDYARVAPEVSIGAGCALFRGAGLTLVLSSSVPLVRTERGVAAEFTLAAGATAEFVLRLASPGESFAAPPPPAQVKEALEETIRYWRRWLSRCSYSGRWREIVHRSALALKLLTYEPTGAIVAAPTAGLPEEIGGVRNWDYRYTWIRDAAFTVYAFLRIGFTDEAAAFMQWLEARCRESDGPEPLQIMYGIDGRRDLTEIELPHLEGYRGSRPVRVGNGAAGQLQLDIYGELMDAVYLYNKHVTPIAHDGWVHLRRLLDHVCDTWTRPDEGIWEVRGGRRHFVYSKLMCWVALDRGIRLADKRSFPADRAKLLRVRDEIYQEIFEKGWDAERGVFVQSYGSHALDASNLIMPLAFFISPTDPRMLRTLEQIRKPPSQGGLVSDGLVYRYETSHKADGLAGDEGTFNLCTFWLVEAMTRASRASPRYLEDARLTFEHMLGYANHLGLYAEETGPSGEALGNFPQAFTHIALISAAFNLDRTLGRRSADHDGG